MCFHLSFKNQHDLRKHMETHNEGAAYRCTVEGCDYSSRMAHTMRQHYRRMHEVSQSHSRGGRDAPLRAGVFWGASLLSAVYL